MSDQTVDVGWIIEQRKILEYLLNPAHPRGASKAKYLLSFGFSPQDPNALAVALVEHAFRNLPGEQVYPPKGSPRVKFEGYVRAPDGRDMPLRTIWEPSDLPPEMRFITAVPLTK